jgi:hypothetical protein
VNTPDRIENSPGRGMILSLRAALPDQLGIGPS